MRIILTPEEKRSLNFFRVNIFLVVLTILLPVKIGGLTVTGYSWTVFFLFSLLTLLTNKKIHFPLIFYLPWVLYLVLYIILDFSLRGLQSTLQYLCPIVAGAAASGFSYNERILARLLKDLKVFGLVLFLGAILLPLLDFGFIRYYSGNAAIVMTTTLIMTVLIAEFFIFRKTINLIYFLLLFLIPFIGLNRMALLMGLVVIPLNLAPVPISRRILLAGVSILAGFLIFYSARVQQKMFFSGRGTFSELRLENPDLYSGGRTYLYQILEEGLKQEPVWGMGPRSDLSVLREAGLEIQEVHNDYLSVRYNYGWVGLALLLLAFALQIISFFRLNLKKWPPVVKVFSASALTLFIPFFGFMYTDNILKYTIFFGTLHFIFIGIIYSLHNSARQSKNPLI